MAKKQKSLTPAQVDRRKRAIKNTLPKVRGADKKQQIPHIIKRGTARMKKMNNRGSR